MKKSMLSFPDKKGALQDQSFVAFAGAPGWWIAGYYPQRFPCFLAPKRSSERHLSSNCLPQQLQARWCPSGQQRLAQRSPLEGSCRQLSAWSALLKFSYMHFCTETNRPFNKQLKAGNVEKVKNYCT